MNRAPHRDRRRSRSSLASAARRGDHEHRRDRDDAAVAPAAGAPRVRREPRERELRPRRSARARPRSTSTTRCSRKGQLLDNYYGIAHNSLPNYIAQISGQGPNPQTQGDCQVYTDFEQIATDGRRTGRRDAAACSRRACRRSPDQLAEPPLHVEGLHGGHRQLADRGEDLPAPGDRCRRRHAAGTRRRRVRRPPRPVRVLPLDHRQLRAARRTSSGSISSPAISERRRRHRTSPTSRRTCATTGTTRRASTAAPAGS